MKQIFWYLILVVVAVIGLVWFVHKARTHAVDHGTVAAHSQAAGNPNPGSPATPPAGQKSQPAAANSSAATGAGSALTPPSADTILRNPPNGMAFSGSGKYQLYRQGDITWRLNTETGDACILFATDAQWSRPEVYAHGCGPA